jgi:hypothetical protein
MVLYALCLFACTISLCYHKHRVLGKPCATLGSICALEIYQWCLVKFKVGVRVILWPTVIGVRPHLGPQDQIFVTVRRLRVCGCGAFSLTRGRFCHLYLLLALATRVILASESCRTHDHISLSQIRDYTNLDGQVPVFISPNGLVAQLYSQALGSLFVVSYHLQGYSVGIQTRFLIGCSTSWSSCSAACSRYVASGRTSNSSVARVSVDAKTSCHMLLTSGYSAADDFFWFTNVMTQYFGHLFDKITLLMQHCFIVRRFDVLEEPVSSVFRFIVKMKIMLSGLYSRNVSFNASNLKFSAIFYNFDFLQFPMRILLYYGI